MEKRLSGPVSNCLFNSRTNFHGNRVTIKRFSAWLSNFEKLYRISGCQVRSWNLTHTLPLRERKIANSITNYNVESKHRLEKWTSFFHLKGTSCVGKSPSSPGGSTEGLIPSPWRGCLKIDIKTLRPIQNNHLIARHSYAWLQCELPDSRELNGFCTKIFF